MSTSSSSSLHPAVTVTNIRNYIPILLEAENGTYTSWVELFKIHCRAFQVIDHILPKESSSSTSKSIGKDAKTEIDQEEWTRLDSIVLQWIYGTISKDLLITILTPNTTAAEACKALEHIFIDSKPSRALYLENKFANTKLENFPNMNAYCQEIKSISDQLTNVDAPVTNQRLVLQLIKGLNDQYESIATLLQQSTPLPDFYTARSKLCLEETHKAHQTTSGTALHAATHTTAPTNSDQQHRPSGSDRRDSPDQQQQRYQGRGQNDSF